MKKRLYLLAILGLFISSTALQGQIVSYGAKLGLSFPGFRDEKIASQRITPTINLAGSLNMSRVFQFQIDLGYQLKGNKYTYNVWDDLGELIEDSTYVVKTNLNYINIPAYFKLNFGGSNTFYVQAGGYYGYLLGARFSGKRDDEMVKRFPIKEGLSPHDFGLIAGGGIETPVRQGLAVILDIKYQYGLKNLNIDPAIVGHEDPVRNKGLVMSMGFMLDLE